MKRCLSVLLSVCLLLCLFPVRAAAADAWDGRTHESYSGAGTSDDPCIIANGAQLYQLSLDIAASSTATSGKFYKLGGDIDLGNKPFAPLGSFFGTLDGDGHTVKGLNVRALDTAYAGLIRALGGTVKNLTLEGSVTGESHAGALAGSMTSGSVVGCVSSCAVSGKGDVGGIIGFGSGGKIENCVNSGTVTGTGRTGGIAGDASSSSSAIVITGCVNKGAVSGACAGGIAGYATYVRIEKCANLGSVSGTGDAGGICGQLHGSYTYSGGYSYYKTTSVENCYNAGGVTGAAAGGICGESTVDGKSANTNTVTACYSAGAVNKTGSGIFGSGSYLTCTNDYYLIVTSANDSAGVHGNTEEEMTYPAEYSGFDFNSVWTWDDTKAYPYPILLNIGLVVPESLPVPLGQYVLNSVSVSDGAGAPLAAIPAGSFWATVSLTNKCASCSALVLLASYDANGRYLGMMCARAADMPVGSTVELSLYVDNADKTAASVKAFVVSSLTELTPLGAAVSFPQS